MLIIWSDGKAKSLRGTIGDVIKQAGVVHKIVPAMDEFPWDHERDNSDIVVLAMGAKAHTLLKDAGLVAKNRTIGSLRGIPISIHGCKVLLTYGPGLVDVDATKLPVLRWDAMLSVRLVTTGSIVPTLGDNRYVDSFHEVIRQISNSWEQTGVRLNVACDLETKGLDEYDPHAWVISCSFTVNKNTAEVVYFTKDECPIEPAPNTDPKDYTYWNKLWLQLHWLFTTDMISMRGANFKFDLRWISHNWGIECTNFRFDTVLVGSLLNENRSNSLKAHAKEYTDKGGYDDAMAKYDFGSLELVPKDELLAYAGTDTVVTYDIADVLKEELLQDWQLSNFYANIMHPASITFQHMEQNGVVVDKEYYEGLRTELEEVLDSLGQQMVDALPEVLQMEYEKNIAEALEERKNPMGPKLLKALLFSKQGFNMKALMKTAKKQEPSTALDHLLMLDTHYAGTRGNKEFTEFIKLFKAYGSASKTMSTYVTGFLKHLRSDGRFHPSYMLFKGAYKEDAKAEESSGSTTGRTSAKDPAVQTYPKHTAWAKKLRRALTAPPGKVILNLDYSQGELRVVACIAKEEVMIDAYLNNKDLHAVTGAQLSGYSFEDFMLLPEDIRDPLRSMAKPANFGLLYAMQAPGFRVYAQTSFGIEMSEQKSVEIREAFFTLYPGLVIWHEACIAFAKKNGYIRSPLGRMRRFPMINCYDRAIRAAQERQSINSGIQSTLSDLMQYAMVLMEREYDLPANFVEMFLMTHDSVGFYIPEGEDKLWAPRFKEIMETLPLEEVFGWNPELTFVADAEVSVPDDEGVHSLAKMAKVQF